MAGVVAARLGSKNFQSVWSERHLFKMSREADHAPSGQM
jgi:hypothetical protein